MALESYGVAATFFYRKFSQIPYGIRANFKLLSAVLSQRQQTFFMAAIKRQIRMKQMIVHWKDMIKAHFFALNTFTKS